MIRLRLAGRFCKPWSVFLRQSLVPNAHAAVVFKVWLLLSVRPTTPEAMSPENECQ